MRVRKLGVIWVCKTNRGELENIYMNFSLGGMCRDNITPPGSCFHGIYMLTLDLNLSQGSHLHSLSLIEFLLQITYSSSFIHPEEVISGDLFFRTAALSRVL